MKLYINAKPDGVQMPVILNDQGALCVPAPGDEGRKPDELTLFQGVCCMITCVRQGWEWERAA